METTNHKSSSHTQITQIKIREESLVPYRIHFTSTMTSSTIDPPQEFCCPITHDLMRDPLMCRNGISFERSAIVRWVLNHENTCPLTRHELGPRDLVPNRALQAQIEAWVMVHQPTDEQQCELDPEQSEELVITCLVLSIDEKLQEAAEKKKRKELLRQSMLKKSTVKSLSIRRLLAMTKFLRRA
jgi:U-box domain